MQHMWVALSYVPIDITEILGDGDELISLHTFTTEMADEIAREESLLGCWHCLTPLNIDTYRSECQGKSSLDLDSFGD